MIDMIYKHKGWKPDRERMWLDKNTLAMQIQLGNDVTQQYKPRGTND